MNIRIKPRKLQGELRAVSSKSDAHRCLIAAALANASTVVEVNHMGSDLAATAACLRALGAGCKETDEGFFVQPIISHTPHAELSCRESGSTARFMLPLAAIFCDTATLRGEGRLSARPFAELTNALVRNGCSVSGDKLPITVGGTLHGGIFPLAGNISSQFVTALLMALPLLSEDSRIVLTSPLESSGYVEMTLRTLAQFGIRIERGEHGYFVQGRQTYLSPGTLRAEGDWSSAAFWLAAYNLGGNVVVDGLNRASAQGDRCVERLLDDLRVRQGNVMIDMTDIPDLLPVLAVAAAAEHGTTVFKNAARLRMKETDRLYTTVQSLRAIGCAAEETEDGICIRGNGTLTGGTADSFGDHRIAMAVAMASMLCEKDVVLHGAEAVEKSYPGFWQDFAAVGGKFDVI